MMKKADVSLYMYLIFVVIIGIMGTVAIMMHMSPISSPSARTLELATSIALYASSMTSVEEGAISLDMQPYKYDIAIQMVQGSKRTGKIDIPSKWISRNGYYVVVVPYVKESVEGKEGKSAEKKGDPAAALISSFSLSQSCNELNLESDCSKAFEGYDKICITKERGKKFPEVKKC